VTTVKPELELPQSVYRSLAQVASACSDSDAARDHATTHGPLDVKALLCMLAEDAAMTHTRPGSWEGANMLQVLSSHGYQF
jgi:hypothetical protein